MTYCARKKLDWALVLAYTIVLYTTLPIAPWFYYRIEGLSGGLYGFYQNVFVLSTAAILMGYLAFHKMEKRAGPYLWFLIIALGYGLFLSWTELASERIHFIEYGLLSWLLMAALRHDFDGPKLLWLAGLIIFLLGFVDEVIQWVLPNRYFELKDVGMNTVGGLLGLLLARFVLMPKPSSA